MENFRNVGNSRANTRNEKEIHLWRLFSAGKKRERGGHVESDVTAEGREKKKGKSGIEDEAKRNRDKQR